VRSLTIAAWTDLIRSSGLSLQPTESFRKRHDFDDRTARSRTTPEAKAELTEMMRSIAPDAEAAFEARWHDNRLVAFSDVKTLFLATKVN
jgi:hypothetical protein